MDHAVPGGHAGFLYIVTTRYEQQEHDVEMRMSFMGFWEDRISPDPAGVFLIDLSACAPGTYIARAFGAAVKLVNP